MQFDSHRAETFFDGPKEGDCHYLIFSWRCQQFSVLGEMSCCTGCDSWLSSYVICLTWHRLHYNIIPWFWCKNFIKNLLVAFHHPPNSIVAQHKMGPGWIKGWSQAGGWRRGEGLGKRWKGQCWSMFDANLEDLIISDQNLKATIQNQSVVFTLWLFNEAMENHSFFVSFCFMSFRKIYLHDCRRQQLPQTKWKLRPVEPRIFVIAWEMMVNSTRRDAYEAIDEEMNEQTCWENKTSGGLRDLRLIQKNTPFFTSHWMMDDLARFDSFPVDSWPVLGSTS